MKYIPNVENSVHLFNIRKSLDSIVEKVKDKRFSFFLSVTVIALFEKTCSKNAPV